MSFFFGVVTGLLVLNVLVPLAVYALLRMRNRKGLYHWPRAIQFLICLADGIPLSAVGKYRNQDEFMEAFRVDALRLNGYDQ